MASLLGERDRKSAFQPVSTVGRPAWRRGLHHGFEARPRSSNVVPARRTGKRTMRSLVVGRERSGCSCARWHGTGPGLSCPRIARCSLRAPCREERRRGACPGSPCRPSTSRCRCWVPRRTGKLVDVLALRVLTTDDWPVWREARLAALAEAPHAFKSRLADWQEGEEERWRARFEMPGSYNVVALLDGRPVGMASGVPGDDGVGEVRSVWVSPAARGRGVGDQLIAAIQDWAVRSGRPALKLAVIPGNEPAVALYRRNGFVVSDEPGSLLSDGVTREQVMVKTLLQEMSSRRPMGWRTDTGLSWLPGMSTRLGGGGGNEDPD